MAELATSPSTYPDELLVLEHFYAWNHDDDRPYEADYGLLPTDVGDVGVFIFPSRPIPHDFFDGNKSDFRELRHLAEIAKGQPGMLSDQHRVLGFQWQEVEQDGQNMVVATFPTASRLNSGLQAIYDTEPEDPPIVFVSKEGEYGQATGKEFIENLGKGRVIISSPIGIERFDHDIGSHVDGYARLDPKTFAMIQRGATQLERDGKLTTGSNGKLVVQEAKDFARDVDSLSKKLRNPYYAINSNTKKSLRNNLAGLETGTTQVRYIKAERHYRDLRKHNRWFSQRIDRLAA